MKVYRIVDKKGRGLYRNLAEKIGMSYQASFEHPGPLEDTELCKDRDNKRISPSTNVRYCFISLTQLKRWMYNYTWIEEAIELRAKLYVFEVPEESVGIGRTQAVFVQGTARLIKKLSLDFLLHE